MLGAEGLGVILGILPLLISAAEHYEDVFRPLKRFKRFCARNISIPTSDTGLEGNLPFPMPTIVDSIDRSRNYHGHAEQVGTSDEVVGRIGSKT